MSIDQRPNWQRFAACRAPGVDLGMFFPGRGESTAEAKMICATCVVRQQCLEYALTNNIKHGIFGGTSERERRGLRRRRGGVAA